MIETTVGRVLFNEFVPDEVGFIDQLLTKKALRDIIGQVLNVSGIAKTAEFLDNIKGIGYNFAFKGGLSFNLEMLLFLMKKIPWYLMHIIRLMK